MAGAGDENADAETAMVVRKNETGEAGARPAEKHILIPPRHGHKNHPYHAVWGQVLEDRR